jgi:outer membrane receptor protein involved in Fe transport
LLNQSGGILATRPSYSLANLRFGVQRGPSELSLNIRNLTNAKPNLGDIGYNGYIQHDAQGAPIPTVATLQPLTVLLQYQKSL